LAHAFQGDRQVAVGGHVTTGTAVSNSELAISLGFSAILLFFVTIIDLVLFVFKNSDDDALANCEHSFTYFVIGIINAAIYGGIITNFVKNIPVAFLSVTPHLPGFIISTMVAFAILLAILPPFAYGYWTTLKEGNFWFAAYSDTKEPVGASIPLVRRGTKTTSG